MNLASFLGLRTAFVATTNHSHLIYNDSKRTGILNFLDISNMTVIVGVDASIII